MKKRDIFLLVISLIVVTFLIYNITVRLRAPAQSELVIQGTIENTLQATGYIIRNERVLRSEVSGLVESSVRDGERVSKGRRIATIYNGELDAASGDRLRIINDRIAYIENGGQRESGEAAADAIGLELQIEQQVLSMISALRTQKASRVGQMQEEISKLMDKKVIISGTAEEKESLINSLKQEKSSIEATMGSAISGVYTQSAGFYYSTIDGFEGRISVEDIPSLTPQALAEVKELSPTKDNNAVAKIVSDFDWYVAVAVNTEDIVPLKKGGSANLRFPEYSSDKIKAEIVHISPDENGESLLVFRMDKQLDTITASRMMHVEIVKSSYSGLRISRSAVRIIDGVTGVYAIKENISKFIPVDILEKNDRYVIAKEDNRAGGLLLYDEVITNSDAMRHGDIVK